MRLLRWLFYAWFSAAAGLLASDAIGFALQLAYGRASANLPWGGLAAAITAGLFVMGTLVFGQWQHFGQRIAVVRWSLLCLLTTLFAIFGFAAG